MQKNVLSVYRCNLKLWNINNYYLGGFQIYKTLEDLVNEEKYEEFYYRHHGGWGYGRGSQLYAALDQEEVVYEDLCSFKKSGQDQVCPQSHDSNFVFRVSFS